MLPADGVHAQAERAVGCGDIIESEFTRDREQQIFVLTMQPKESFSASIEPVGDYLETAIAIQGPTGIMLGVTNRIKAPVVESGTLSARGTYKILVMNVAFNGGAPGGVGIYALYIGCVKSDGTIIKPGDSAQPTPTPAPLPTPTPRSALPAGAPEFAGVGFPGLAPVDFSSVAKVPLLPDTVMTGVIPTGNEIIGFTLNAAAGDTLDLSYTRVSGNMNLGLVVLSAENEVFFQASLVTSASLATQFTLPVAGQYTIGVFRISLVEPAKVEPTVFQLKVTTAD
jgi:hypothetical protein